MQELAEVVNIEHRGQLFLISAVIELSNDNKENAEKMLKESAKCSPETCRQFLDGETVDVLPLHTGNEFSQRYELIPLLGFPKVQVRPAVTLPKFLPALELQDTYGIIKAFFTFQTITPRPEAPWLNRNKGSIQFTESILELEPEDSKKTSKIIPAAAKPCRSQEIRRKSSSFVKNKANAEEKGPEAGLFEKIKEICS